MILPGKKSYVNTLMYMKHITRSLLQKLSKYSWTFIVKWFLILFISYRFWSWIFSMTYQLVKSLT